MKREAPYYVKPLAPVKPFRAKTLSDARQVVYFARNRPMLHIIAADATAPP